MSLFSPLRSSRWWQVLLCSTLCWLPIRPALHAQSTTAATEPDGPSARRVVAQAARAAFQGSDYALLEKTAEELRKTKARFPEGVWKLPSFYDGLDPKYEGARVDWDDWFRKLDAWKAAFPDSITQPVARASALVAYGWDARGGGYANTVTSDGWKLLAERLAQARGTLEEAAKLPTRDPNWYRVMQSVALGESWDDDRAQALFAEAVAAEPTYYHYYFARVTAELPRWGGDRDAWVRFAEEAVQRYDPQEGLSIYARIVWSHQGAVGGGFQNPKVQWEKVRQGFRDIEKQYPNSNWNLNNFCRFACMAGDRETARELFARIGEAVSVPAWEGRAAFDGWRQWANTQETADLLRASLTIPTDERLMVQAVAFAPDGKTLLAGYDDGAVRIWNLESRKLTWGVNPRRGEVYTVAFSADGKLFAAGTGDQSNNRTPGHVELRDAETHQLVATIDEGWEGNVFGLAFTPDNRTLAIVGGRLGAAGGAQSLGEVAFYDLEAKKLLPPPWEGGKYPLNGVAISRDGRYVVTAKGRSINAWDLGKKGFVGDFHTRATHARSVWAVAISPDGKTLVTGAAPSWNERDTGNGGLRRWDMGAEGWPEIKEPAWEGATGGVLAVAFSPDGRWLASGGYDGSVQLREAATGKVAAVLTGHQQRIGSLAFSPDSKTLASGAADGVIKWWNVPMEKVP